MLLGSPIIKSNFKSDQNKIITRVSLSRGKYGTDPILSYRALWDTGATNSSISTNVFKELQLDEICNIETLSVHGAKQSSIFYVLMVFMDVIGKPNYRIPVIHSTGLYKQDVDVLIGMDIIRWGKMVVEGFGNGKIHFEFTPGDAPYSCKAK